MANERKVWLLGELKSKFGTLNPLPHSQSLFDIGDGKVRIYIRYSKIHGQGKTFFGLRDVDLKSLDDRPAFLCLLLDDGSPPIFINYADFEEIFRLAEPASDGQHKVQLRSRDNALALYIARQGWFNVEGYIGFEVLERKFLQADDSHIPDLTHSQVQTLLAGIGYFKGHDVWVPDNDVGRLDWTLTNKFSTLKSIPTGYEQVAAILQEIDVVWTKRGSNKIEGLFEVEHSTSIYSGLLRFNDIFLTMPSLSRFTIVSDQSRRALFARQVRRPTFVKSGLSDIAIFMEYTNVFDWYRRLSRS